MFHVAKRWVAQLTMPKQNLLLFITSERMHRIRPTYVEVLHIIESPPLSILPNDFLGENIL